MDVFRYGRDALVTGGSSGIGLATARLLADNGFRVFAASRHPPAAVTGLASGGCIVPLTLDVSSSASVDAAMAQLDTVGVVVHAAGIGIAGAAADTPDDAAHRQFETNYFGVLRVNRALLPGMMAAGRGLVVLVGSVASMFPIPFQSHYSSSKAALAAYGRALAMELAGSGVRVAVVEPGDTKTAFTDSRTFETAPESPFHDACLASVARMERDERNGRPPEAVARQILALTRRRRPGIHSVVGLDYNLLVGLGRLLPTSAIDFALRKMYVRGGR